MLRRLALGLAAILAVLAIPTAAGAAIVPASSNWGQILRNTDPGSLSALTAGPNAPGALGAGSVGFSVPTGGKAVWGDEVDYLGVPLASIDTLSFNVFQTGEMNAIAPANLPNVTLEIDTNGGTLNAGEYSSLNGISDPVAAADLNRWSTVTPSEFYLTGAAGTSSGCNQVTYCTLAEVKAKFPDATILSVGINKGHDYAWNGAIDGFTINDKTFDFELPQGPAGDNGTNGSNGKSGTPGAPGQSSPGLGGQSAPAGKCVSNKSLLLHSKKGARRTTVTYINGFGKKRTVRVSRSGTRISFAGREVKRGTKTTIRIHDHYKTKTKTRTLHRTLCG